MADDLRLKQIISNIVSNAIKFTDKGGVSVTIQGFKKSGRHQLLMSIQESRIGIDPEKGKALFSPFRQIDSNDERRYEGTYRPRSSHFQKPRSTHGRPSLVRK